MTPHLKTLLVATFYLVGAHQALAGAQSKPQNGGLLVPVAGQCGKYKMDGTGNCLTPEFYQCQEDWAKCTKACNANEACQEACDTKYSAECGD